MSGYLVYKLEGVTTDVLSGRGEKRKFTILMSCNCPVFLGVVMICVCSLGTFSSVYNIFSATSEIPKVRSTLVEHQLL